MTREVQEMSEEDGLLVEEVVCLMVKKSKKVKRSMNVLLSALMTIVEQQYDVSEAECLDMAKDFADKIDAAIERAKVGRN